jgi:hypothetical protein
MELYLHLPSKTLDIMSKRLMGQYDVSSLGGGGGLWFLDVVVLCDHCARKYPFSMAALNN